MEWLTNPYVIITIVVAVVVSNIMRSNTPPTPSLGLNTKTNRISINGQHPTKTMKVAHNHSQMKTRNGTLNMMINKLSADSSLLQRPGLLNKSMEPFTQAYDLIL
ncbi:hypothetical protein [Salinivibrio socompensis]|uniref:hypothetical protein n=1 Tax=Salinivibrio socompensis TaxID=1510206 RepID=UPI00056CE74E|nr:hypothetical protein [Salinivibrio socompensis]